MENYLDAYIEDLLHINEVSRNKLVDLCGELTKTYILSHGLRTDTAAYALSVIRARFGKTGNTVLRGSALSGEQILGRDVNDFEWKGADGTKDAKQLSAFIAAVYKELNLKGNNPLFLSVGALRWKVAASKDEVKEVLSPLLVFPIRLIRSVGTTPVFIEFVDDDVYFNPCLYHKLRQVLGDEVADAFPHPNGAGAFDEPVSLEKLGSGEEYFASVEAYVKSCKRADAGEAVFEFERDTVAIAQYNHDELCMYYDIRRNKEKIAAHPLVRRIFTESVPENRAPFLSEPQFVLPRDSVQEDMIRRVVNGESLIIKGPPGTGKTQTIANMIAALMAENKKVLLSSKKLSALSEVNAKLPAPLRKFVLLLDCETETQAAKVNPSEIKKDLRALVRAKREYAADSAAYKARESADAEKASAVTFLSDYAEKVFSGDSIAGGSYYDALDVYLKNNLETIPFCDPRDAVKISRSRYDSLLSAVNDAGNCFAAMTGGETHPFAKCPWAGVGAETDTEAAFSEYARLADLAERAHGALAKILGECENARVQDVRAVISSPLGEDAERALLSAKGIEKECGKLSDALAAYLFAKSAAGEQKASLKDEAGARAALPAAGFGPAELLTFEEFSLVCGGAHLFYAENGNFLREGDLALLSSLAQKNEELKARGEKYLYEARRVISEEACRGEAEFIAAAYAPLAKYRGGAKKPKTFDFKAKKAYEKISAMSFTGGAEFSEAVEAVCNFKEALRCAEEAEKNALLVFKIFRRKLEKEQLAAVFAADAAAKRAGMPVQAFLEEACAAQKAVSGFAACIRAGTDGTIGQAVAACRAALAEADLKKALSALFDRVGAALPTDAAAEKSACAALALRSLFASVPFASRPPEKNLETAKALRGAQGLGKTLEALSSGLAAFGEKFFRSGYSAPSELLAGDLAVFAREADDRRVLSASLRYGAILNDPKNALPIREFFAPFEKGDPAHEGTFAEIFEHSFYALAIAARMAAMGLLRNGLGKNVARSLANFAAAEKKEEKADVSLIEGRCMARIDADDPDFAFLASERDPSSTLRSLFKKYAGPILKLKKCFILSPSTASVLFRPEEYENFDAVIVDEASQLEPVNLLPVLFRSKQCVIVGDEWQMPPIKHFVSKYEKRVTAEDGSESFVLEPELSALTLALRNRAFRAEELVCHYRSKTESLIAFSQKEFYPSMRTFPAPVPHKTGLGFTDIYVPEGRCEKGVNLAEAQKVLECLRSHFECFYDEKKEELTRSFGVVAFGEEQIECIKKLVRADRELNAKLTRALAHFGDVPEKLAFFKTIETVQGQETAQLILSLTYGKTAEGKVVNSFGQLNRDKLGKCIFNVAVTRAQYGVTVIHSVEPEEITAESVSYIRDYLMLSRRFGGGGRDQFVSEEPGKGFIRSVADFIESCGVAKERIVCGYGVTEGSVRMPIAVLSADLGEAQLGVWCEKPTGGKYNYLDYNMRYVQTLKDCGWNLHRICAHDWIDNAEAERESLAAAIGKYVK